MPPDRSCEVPGPSTPEWLPSLPWRTSAAEILEQGAGRSAANTPADRIRTAQVIVADPFPSVRGVRRHRRVAHGSARVVDDVRDRTGGERDGHHVVHRYARGGRGLDRVLGGDG